MKNIRISLALLCAALSIVLVSCGDNPADSPSEDHIEAFGFVLYNSGEEIVRYQNGVVQGSTEAVADEDTPLFNLRFLDENGNIISTDKLTGDEHRLRWEVSDTSIADVEQHDDDGKWNFHITGKKEGETKIKIMLFHHDHADFTSKEVAIHVAPGVQIAGLKMLLNGNQVLTADTQTASSVLSMFNGAM